MIKHVVMWKLKDESKAENAVKMKEMLEALPCTISEIKELEVGIADERTSDACSDIVLYSAFESAEALEIYQKHPDHQAVGAFVKTVAVERRVVDYTV